eukprot:COSAG06_NODE_49196_length_327_cov_0.675439_1_plen_67_part_10
MVATTLVLMPIHPTVLSAKPAPQDTPLATTELAAFAKPTRTVQLLWALATTEINPRSNLLSTSTALP